ncbi:MAG: histidine phosphatase family protein [Bryobacteraceae bacterium]
MPVIHLIRHAEPALTGALLGSSDIPLSSESIAPSLLAVDRVYSSPLARAHRTAQLLFPERRAIVVPELAERGLGAWEKLTWSQVEQAWPEQAREAERDWFAFTPPDGETWVAFVERVTRAWCNMTLGESTAIVAHSGVNSVLRSIITGATSSSFHQDYCEALTLVIPDPHSAHGQ